MKLLPGKLTLLLPSIIIIPFIVISFFNHPALDDWWYAEVHKQYGLAGAQHYWYTHYTARFFSNFLMTIAPLSFGWMEGHKVMPVIFIALLFCTFFYISKIFFMNKPSLKWSLPLWFTAAYLLIQRDYFESIYWLAGNVVYQYTMLYLLLHITIMYELFFLKKITSFKLILPVLLAIAIVGSNETLGGLVLVESVLVLVYCFKKNRLKMFSIFLLSAVIASWIVMFMARGNWDKIKVATGEHVHTFDMFLAVKHSLISIGYYTVFLLKQPFFWCLAILSIPGYKFLINERLKLNDKTHLLALAILCFAIAFTIYFISIYPTGILIPPLRVTNIAMIFLFTGTILTISFISERVQAVNNYIVALNKYKYWVTIACVLLAIVSPTKFQQLLSDLVSGRAAAYNEAMYSRYSAIKSHNGTDTLYLPKLVNVPRTIVATDISGPVSENMAMIFGKTFKVKIVD